MGSQKLLLVYGKDLVESQGKFSDMLKSEVRVRHVVVMLMVRVSLLI